MTRIGITSRGRANTMAEKLEFKKGDFVVYPAHGVGRVEGVDTFAVAGRKCFPLLHCVRTGPYAPQGAGVQG